MHSWWKKYKVLANLTPEIKLFEKWMRNREKGCKSCLSVLTALVCR